MLIILNPRHLSHPPPKSVFFYGAGSLFSISESVFFLFVSFFLCSLVLLLSHSYVHVLNDLCLCLSTGCQCSYKFVSALSVLRMVTSVVCIIANLELGMWCLSNSYPEVSRRIEERGSISEEQVEPERALGGSPHLVIEGWITNITRGVSPMRRMRARGKAQGPAFSESPETAGPPLGLGLLLANSWTGDSHQGPAPGHGLVVNTSMKN